MGSVACFPSVSDKSLKKTVIEMFTFNEKNLVTILNECEYNFYLNM